MKRIGIITLIIGLSMSCFVSCTSDSDMPDDKELLLETLTNGSWEVALKHSLTQNDFDHSEVQLTFTDAGKVSALGLEGFDSVLSTRNGAYKLFYGLDNGSNPDFNDPDYDELDWYSANDEDLFLSFAFGMRELILFNHRWEVKDFSSTNVQLQANDISLILKKIE
ncbi:hypothetical protein [Carboxylicivirga sp. RSCT41]|uniref:hypothetical protein n=1 Tax=Carboxylicivirga agarovorans TaxID=3417570 RepID=UPI003D33F839